MGSRGRTLIEFLDQVYVPSKIELSQGRIAQLRVTAEAITHWARKPLKIRELTEDTAVRFLAHYHASGRFSPATTNTRRQNLLAMARLAYRRGLLSEDPNRWDVPRVREPRRVPRAWTRQEVTELVTASRRLSGNVGSLPRRLWWPAFLLALWDCGCRVGALLLAETQNLSLEQGFLILTAPKTALESLYWLSDSTLAAIGAIWCPHRQELFPWPYGRDWLWRYFRGHIVEPSGVWCPRQRQGKWLFHCLRRSRLSDQARGSLEDARRLAGHTRPETTLHHYVDPRIADPGVRPPSLEAGDDGRMWFI